MIKAISQKNPPFLLNEEEILTDSPVSLIKPWEQILNEIFPWLACLLLLTVCGLWMRRLLKNRRGKDSRTEESISMDPFEEAMQAIANLQDQKNVTPKAFVFKLSEILRIYVERLFKLPAMELTGEEFLLQIANHSFFKNRYEDALRDFVEKGDQIKYSQEAGADNATIDLLTLATNFLTDTHGKLEEEKAMTSNKIDSQSA